MVWRIVVLDDEQECIDTICYIAGEYLQEHGIPYKVRTYTTAEALLEDLYSGEEADIYLLDIELPGMNGIEVARRIREKQWNSFLIYITNYIQYTMDAFEVNTFRYISKISLHQNLPKAFQSVQKILEQYKGNKDRERYYIIEAYDEINKINYRDIIYMKKEMKYVSIKCTHGTYRVRKSLAEVIHELDADNFLIIERGYGVNVHHVTAIKNQQIILDDGTTLPVARARWKNVKEVFLRNGG